MKKLEKLNNDLFKKFEKDEITDLSSLTGGTAASKGVSSAVIICNMWCAHDTAVNGTMTGFSGCEKI